MEKKLFFILINIFIISEAMGEMMRFCKAENDFCFDNFQCCGNSCQPLGLGSMRNICKRQKYEPITEKTEVLSQCLEIGSSCSKSSECCSNFCRFEGNPILTGLCDTKPKAPLVDFLRKQKIIKT